MTPIPKLTDPKTPGDVRTDWRYIVETNREVRKLASEVRRLSQGLEDLRRKTDWMGEGGGTTCVRWA